MSEEEFIALHEWLSRAARFPSTQIEIEAECNCINCALDREWGHLRDYDPRMITVVIR